MRKNIFIIVLVTLLLPVATIGAGLDFDNPPAGGIVSLIDVFDSILDIVWMAFFFIAVIMFIVAGSIFLLAQGDPTEIARARRFAIWGTVGIAVAILGFSIVNIVYGLLF